MKKPIQKGDNMANHEKATPVMPEEADDIRVTLELDEGEVECSILTIFEAGGRDYIALMPQDKQGNETGDVYLYRYSEDEEGLPSIDPIESDEEYEIAADKFDEFLDDNMFDTMDDDE